MEGTYNPHLLPIKKKLRNLIEGDVIERGNIGKVIFIRFKRGAKSFEAKGLEDNKSWSCRIGFTGLDKDVEVLGQFDKQETPDERDQLKVGDLFMFKHKKDHLVLRYQFTKPSGKIEATSPVDDTDKWTIGPEFKILKVENYLREK